MALDLYSPCPCGSGKKFKWCCQPIHVQIDKAFRQEAEGQHEAALRLMDEVIAEHPANPEAYGRKAQLLYQNDRVEEAENTLQKALDINPNYPFGHLLRAVFRQHEGETGGALLLLRKAADLYDREAHDYLAQVYSMIAECELKLNHPVAAHAALKLAVRYQPGSEDLRRGLDELFGDKSRLPAVARRDYAFQSPAGAAAQGRREAWDRALAGDQGARLSEAARSFADLAAQDADDDAAWYNLGLTRAWLGDNRGGIEALDRYVALAPDEATAAAAWALAAVLRCGHGMEDQADYIENSALYQVRNPQQAFSFLQQWEGERRLIGVQVSEDQGLLTGLVLERLAALTPELAAVQLPRLGCYLLIAGEHLRLWNTDAGALEKVRQELHERVGPALSAARTERGPVNFGDVLAEALVFPVQTADKEEATRRVLEHMQRYFEEAWIHRPLPSLDFVPPVDAAGHAVLRRKLLGDIQFLEDCAAGGQARNYDFDRLRHKLGLVVGAAAPDGAAAARPDIGAMDAADLSALQVEALADEDLEQAYQTALKLDARDLAGRFARALVSRPPHAERPDRFPWYSHLVQLALADGDTDNALNLLNDGEKADCEQNSGNRRNDYELRRGQIHAKRGEAEEAQNVFDRLIERVPSELRYRGAATEAMLSARQGARALHFAEQALAKALERNDRDSEEYFKELVAAAHRQGA
jgi:tetratricopeptide (TPR) repeat protein